SDINLNNVLIAENTSNTLGGGFYIYGSSSIADMTNVTMISNSAVNEGNAIYLAAGHTMTLNNSIIWEHSSPAFSGPGVITATYSDIQDSLYPGTGNIFLDPYFIDANNDDFTLRWDDYPYLTGIKSPCIDAGDPASPKDPDSTWVDMGAYYFHQDHTLLTGGNISDTLFCSESPYFVLGDLTIPVGEELLIEPCVRVIFQGDYRLQPEGRLLALGNETDSIYFYPSDTTNGWQGIRYYGQNTNGQDSSKMQYCNIWYGNANGIDADSTGGGLYFNNSSDVLIENSNIGHNKAYLGGGAYVNHSSIPKIFSNSFENNTAEYGGGIYIDSSNCVIEECSISFNTANSDGGGIYFNEYSQPELLHSKVNNNYANHYGGGIYTDSSNFEIAYCQIFENKAYQHGGGILQYRAESNIHDVSIYNNQVLTDFQGGGIHVSHATANIKNAIIEGNKTENYGSGGGIANLYSNLSIDSSLIRNNESRRGGGILSYYGHFDISNSEFVNNSAQLEGGALYIGMGSGEILNTTINSNNSWAGGGVFCTSTVISFENTNIINNECSGVGGGLAVYHADLDFFNVLISENLSNDIGGGIYFGTSNNQYITNMKNLTFVANCAANEGNAIYMIPNNTVNINNSIIWDHTSSIFSNYGTLNITYSDIENEWSGTGNINQDPMFMYPDEDIYNLSWMNYPVEDNTKSPCINTGDPSSPLDPDGSRADMGAFPFVAYQFSPAISSIDDVPNDQGKQVVLNWNKSELDNVEHAIIDKYTIWRQQNWAKTPWEYIGETPAHFFDEYAYIAPTISDSTAAGVPYYTYLISAETADPFIFYNSLADSGYSVDNLAPEPPKGLYGYQEESLVKLFWNQVGEDDFDYFALYKSDDPENFPSDPYVTLSDTIYDDPDLSNDTLYYKLTAFDYNGNQSPSSETIEILTGKNLDLKVFLEGPFFVTQMIPFLNLGGYIPLTQPYNQPPWNYTGDEMVDQLPNSDIIDWVLLEFRDATDPTSAGGSTVVYQTAAFLIGDGAIVGLDGTNQPKVNLDYNHNLYLVVWHRNHMGIISALPVTESANSYTYDFTDMIDKTYGGEKAVKFLNTGIWGMIAADGNADGQIDNKDKNDIWYLQRFLSGYLQGDFDMDTDVDLMDKENFWESNSGKSSFVPE
ncbi:MAG: right-handed parallel beta-helix repeat-containing protein, partial [Bacteroidales bacterium]|nr:right-handed parallel beta-helix repeat-containing protein [Bacteroidales bacterium]